MSQITVSAEKSYPVFIDHKWSEELLSYLANRTRVAVVVSEGFRPDLSHIMTTDCEIHVFEIPDGEAGKSFATLEKLWNWLGATGFTRTDLVVGIGGGAITDVAGFAASTWLRGIDWIAVPTSLAGMVDAAIGGKTGINSDYGKNLVGAFYSPIAVIIDLEWMQTLSDRDFAAGMAEVIKCGFIVDPHILEIAGMYTIQSLRSDLPVLKELISRSVQVKADVVTGDFKESYGREALNYGHTLAHAIEKDSKYQLRHGEAVSIGLVYVSEIAYARELISGDERDLHKKILSSYDLPVSYPRQAWTKLLPLIALDKKTRGNTVRFVVLQGIGSTIRLEDLTSDELESAYERISS